MLKLNDLDKLAFFIAAACHDFKHDGFTNQFHSNTFTERAMLSNDIAVQEHYHTYQTFVELGKQE